jgi:hypothetical protein
MGPRGIVIAGLVAGIATAVIVLVGAVLLLPEPPAVVDPSPTAAPTATVGPVETTAPGVVSPTESPGVVSPTASPSAPPSASPSAQASIGTAAFHGDHAPDLSVDQAGGWTNARTPWPRTAGSSRLT